jgi:hypothetical protein
MSVDWHQFDAAFDAVDTDGDECLDFTEFVHLAEGRALDARETTDTIALMELKHTTLGEQHVTALELIARGGDRQCRCYDCMLRRMAGFWHHNGANHAVDLVVTKGTERAGGLYVATMPAQPPPKKNILGAMVHDGESESAALRTCFIAKGFGLSRNCRDDDSWRAIESFVDQRELFNEESLAASRIFEGRVDDPRNTDDAWVESQVFHIHVSEDDVQRMNDLGFQCEWEQLPSLRDVPSGFGVGEHGARTTFVELFRAPSHAEWALIARTRVHHEGGSDSNLAISSHSLSRTSAETSARSLAKAGVHCEGDDEDASLSTRLPRSLLTKTKWVHDVAPDFASLGVAELAFLCKCIGTQPAGNEGATAEQMVEALKQALML